MPIEGRAIPLEINLFVGTNNTTLSNQQLGEFNAQVGPPCLKVDVESKRASSARH